MLITRTHFLWLAMGAALIIVAVLLLRRPAPAVVYQGKTILAWSRQLYEGPDQLRTAEARAAFKAMGEQAVPKLITQLRTREPFFARPLWRLEPQMPRWLRKVLLHGMKPSEVDGIRAAAARSLGSIGPQASAAVPALAEALRDSFPPVSLAAASALGAIGPASVPVLVNALRDPEHQVRHRAAYALGEIGPGAEAAIPGLIERLSDSDGYVRSSASYSLSKMGAQASTALIEELNHGQGLGRQAAARALAAFNPPLKEIEPPLLRMMRDKDPGLRVQAIEILTANYVYVASNEAVKQIVECLDDSAAEVRLAAIKGLGNASWKARPAVKRLTQCLKEPSAATRLWSARTLGAIGAPAESAVPALVELTQDPNELVRLAAAEAVAKIEGRRDSTANLPPGPPSLK